MAYDPNQPNINDDLDVSAKKLQDNSIAANTSFGKEHYPFSDLTPNNGYHNTVTQPLIIGGAHPTTVANPIIYAMQDSTDIGVLQYSKGPKNTAPTPLTTLQSPLTPISVLSGGSFDILDFTGLNSVSAVLWVWDLQYSDSASEGIAVWSSSFNGFISRVSTGLLQPNMTGSVLYVTNVSPSTNLNNTYWTLQFLRIN